MAKRSLKASEAGRVKAKKAFERTGWTQEYLAYQVGLGTRQSVWKFFTGRPVDRGIFHDLCFQLDLEWEEIVDSPVVKPKDKTLPSKDTSVPLLKAQLKEILAAPLAQTTGAFDICQPLPLNRLYTDQHFLPTIHSQRWLELHELKPNVRAWGQSSGTITSNPSATQFIQGNQKLFILGAPGSGKTTLLHHLASKCLEGELYPDHIPIFIPLRSFVLQYADQNFPALETYLQGRLPTGTEPQLSIPGLLQEGRFLLLLDGLDEVSTKARLTLGQTIQSWAQTYGHNRFILTCRPGAQHFHFQGFTYTELSEFSSEQIEKFVQNFFTLASAESGDQKARNFLEQLSRRPNQPIRDLVTTPILLNLVCSIFLARKTLPSNRAKLYQVALEIFIERWDAARGIARNQTESISLTKAERFKLLSDLAFKTFEKEQLLFGKQDLLCLITDYWRSTLSESGTPQDPETLWEQGEQLIQTIASQHGVLVERAKDIYGFSHLTFHEYLTARNIVATPDASLLESRLEALAGQVSQDHWQEVIMLTVNLLPEPLDFLKQLQHYSCEIIRPFPRIQTFLQMIQDKTETLESLYPRWTLRAVYFSTLVNVDPNLIFAPSFAAQRLPELALDISLVQFWSALERVKENALMSRILKLYSAFNFETQHLLRPDFRTAIKTLKAELPTQQNGKRGQQHWWQQEGQAWSARWDKMVRKYRGLSLAWAWSPQEAQALQTYYQATQLMVNCVQCESRLSDAQRNALMARILTAPLEQTTNQEQQQQPVNSHEYRHKAFAPA